MEISEKHLQTFKKIKNLFLKKTIIPKPNNWRSLSANDIWLRIMTQIIIIQGADSGIRFNNNMLVQDTVEYEKLAIMNEIEAKETINKALRKIGTRMASSEIAKCWKTNCLYENLLIIKNSKTGLIGLLHYVTDLAEQGKIDKAIDTMKQFSGFGDKSARDFLMEYGIIEDAIALDVRVVNLLSAVGLQISEKYKNNTKIYLDIEQSLLNKVCKPLDIKGIEFDRMIFNHNKDNLLGKAIKQELI